MSESLTREESDELASRTNLISFYRRTVSLLESEKNLFISHLLTSKGLDPEKQYAIDPETLEINEVSPDG